MQTIQNDTVSLAAQPLLNLFHESSSSNTLTSEVQQEIKNFQGDMSINSSGALIFNAWVDQLTRAVFSDKLGESFERLYPNKGLRDGLLNVLKNHPDVWCLPSNLPDIKSCNDLSQLAMDRALNYLTKRYGKDPKKWQWGDAHPAVGAHKPLGQIAFLSQFFNISVPSAGDGQTVNVGSMSFKNNKDPYSSGVAAGMRAVYDLSNLNQSTFIGFGGQSGWVQSPRYKEYSNSWSKGNYLPLMIDPKDFKSYQLNLSPDQSQSK